MKEKESTKKVEIVAAGGLANRMRAILSALTLAEVSGRRCSVRWDNNDDLKADFSDLFLTESLPFEIEPIATSVERFLLSMPRKKNLYLPALSQKLRYGLRLYDGVNSENYGEQPERLLRGARDSKKDILVYSGQVFYPFPPERMKEIFRFSDRVKERALEISKGAGSFDYGFHVRRTDNVDSIAKSPIEVFESKIEELIASQPKVRIFLASDSQEVKDHLSARYPGMIHYNPSVADRKSLQGMIDAAAEMSILAATRGIFGSYWSSYSEIAAMLGGTELKVLSV